MRLRTVAASAKNNRLLGVVARVFSVQHVIGMAQYDSVNSASNRRSCFLSMAANPPMYALERVRRSRTNERATDRHAKQGACSAWVHHRSAKVLLPVDADIVDGAPSCSNGRVQRYAVRTVIYRCSHCVI
eukprot:Polyplicarium_translucidae@DN516_c0_g1_i1.p1